MDSEDEFVPEGTASTTPQKRKPGKSKAKAPAKKRAKKAIKPAAHAAVPSLSQDADALDAAGLDKIDIAIDHRTTILNEFLRHIKDEGLKAKTDIRHEYTPCFGRARHVLDLPFYDIDNRNYVLLEDQVELYDEVRDGETVRVWRLLAQNQADPQAQPVALFMFPSITKPSKAKHITTPTFTTGFNILSETVVPEDEREKVVALGKVKVDIMNRAPMDLDVERWSDLPLAPDATMASVAASLKCSYERRFIDLTALTSWMQSHNPEFDIRNLSAEVHRDKFWNIPTPITVKASAKIERPVAIWCTDLAKNKNRECQIVVVPALLDADKVESEPTPSKRFHLWEFHKNSDSFKEGTQMASAVKIAKVVSLAIIGHVGTRQQIRLMHEDMRAAFTSGGRALVKGIQTGAGSYNNGPFWLLPNKRGTLDGVYFKFGPKATQNLDLSGISMGTSTQDLAHRGFGFLLQTRMLSNERIHHAFFMQTAISSLARGDSLLNVILHSKTAAQMVDLGLISIEQIIETYCTCSSEQRGIVEHVCMHCY